MIPMSNGTYRHIGVGIARDGDVYYYILQAAYTSSNAWQPYYSSTPGEGTEVSEVTDSGLSEWMSPVITSTPHADGSIIHVVQPGQTLWSIAIAYGTKILDILAYNNLPSDYQTIYTGQILAIPVTAVPVPTQTPEATITPISTIPVSTPRFTQSSPSPSSSITLTTLPSTPEVREIKIRNILFYLLGTGVIFLLAGFLMKNPKK